MVKVEWVRTAMTDDTLVAELLVRLKQSQAASSSHKSWPRAVIPLRWGLRQPRSRPAAFRCDVVPRRKEADSRCSPTTPLSWSGGGGSPSATATADGFEESNVHASFYFAAFRSKGTAANESTATKRSRRKKTFAELKDEENSLLKERIYLKKELATLRATFKEQKARNESFKRMKLDLILHSAKNPNATVDGQENAVLREPIQASTSYHTFPRLREDSPNDDTMQSEPCTTDKATASVRDSSCFLPDLNMMPSEEDSSS
ncbi:hypothetical protein I3843_07G222200 [Carya illinoinensis]|uniref:Uncharacterized protein n=1 Tax=Carya illinoinensis TaxID=32201 RepID=A0A8T1Q6N4_CARIL|nr:uncharacterized protein LOC122316771 [Carya illinoinensis]KAG6649670.1 hypothetical protein CIPAW_07G227200 [Carya illinoinensis]KAG6706595.1 hypothetical protein I3842_07G228800 [Carya illinoinensis]KAG7973333.1 hypothetical protein I3843_07G222200 [Carya illinoinensis]